MMDLMDVLLALGLLTMGLVAYLSVRSAPKKKGNYSEKGWNYPFKYLNARYAVKRWKARLSPSTPDEALRADQTEGYDSFFIRTSASDGSIVFLGIRRWCGRKGVAEVTLYVQLADGTFYKLPSHPETVVGEWDSEGWSAGGLKIQVLQPEQRLRIIFNGLLREGEGVAMRHVTINLIWSAASAVVRHPEDWAEELAARALALEPWRDDKWPERLNRSGEGSRLQWGCVQGRIQAYNFNGVSVRSEWLRCRGTKERAWAPKGFLGVHRTVNITVGAQDGTMVNLWAVAYKDVLTQVFSGSVRYPNSVVESITSTDLSLQDYCEDPHSEPANFTINVTTKSKSVRVFLRPAQGGRLLGGALLQLQYRALHAAIDGDSAVGLLELGYTAAEPLPRTHRPAPRAALRWSAVTSRDPCLWLDHPAAANPALVGGKGASLALLSKPADNEDYVVPPAYCVTSEALERQLAAKPELRRAVEELQAAGHGADEAAFRESCDRAAALFEATDVIEDVKESIISYLHELRKKALEENYGPDLRFAVRSSAVGEDGEALSAAGQNATVLGCSTDDDVTRAVARCWGSMFAFNSAHYRRQNGQAALCGGGVVVQALARARSAGVLFTRHPAAGHPARLLLTANYGLGETVVSGSVEPDTFIIFRDLLDQLAVGETTLGTKTERITTTETGVKTEAVSDEERKKACLSEEEVLRLGRLAVRQEALWGAPRDIEWAFVGDQLCVVQARPVTSLERWTEEELLHEMDLPIMSDEDLATFGNVGEVMPKCLTPLTLDMVLGPLNKSMCRAVAAPVPAYSGLVGTTHYRTILLPYNSLYSVVGPKVDMNLRMIEMAVHGHAVADDNIHAVAVRRSPPSRSKKLAALKGTFSALYNSKSYMKNTIRDVDKFKIDELKTEDPLELLDAIEASQEEMGEFMINHAMTSSASTSSQIIAMAVLLEGAEEFTPEHCNEVGAMLSSGDAVSAEVPHRLSSIAAALHKSGRADDFRAIKPTEGLDWLDNNLPDVARDVQEFLKEHGHRALMEFDLATKPWVLSPEQMIEVLQRMPGNTVEAPKQKSDNEIIAALKTPKKNMTRRILSYLLPLCRRMVVYREGTKAHLILAIHKLRLASLRLARLLAASWLLPDEDLIFYFRVDELRSYIQTRDPVLLRKATQRRQYFPSWSKLKFDEMQTGWPSPEPPQTPVVSAIGACVRATPVAGGDVIARACVIRELSEIGSLRRGDILVTHSTDIGWSPYFPLLAGIATELGGLISHGAVIARECGLPCVVGAAGATAVFRTGDVLRLSGAAGTLEKVALADTESTELE